MFGEGVGIVEGMMSGRWLDLRLWHLRVFYDMDAVGWFHAMHMWQRYLFVSTGGLMEREAKG